ncbi:MAG TPA: serine hydrolase domain-containing protein [Candidatus Dormibacteraeota bacterium]|nr:serine hydrolase domain-containing protein [Candidatus Dormibacteraeota bacterium]
MTVAVVVIVAAGFVYVYPTLTSKPAPKAGPITAIDHFISAQMQQQRFSGTVLIAQNGRILLDKGYGWADEGQRLRNQPSTRFRIASITKQFTAMAILLLQEQGRLHVQDPICRYITGCPATWNTITIQHVLTHTSGIPEYATTLLMQQPASPAQLIAAFESEPLDFAPGAKFSYSNSGYVILGSIIEKLSGETYSEFLQQAIFRALHLSNTGYDQNFPPLPEHATGYKQPWVKADYVDMSVPFAAGALYSTVDDLYRWDAALFNRTFASSDSVTQMFTPQVTSCDQGGTPCTASECDAQRVNCYSYGYGWFLGQFPVDPQYVRVIWHSGGLPGFVSLNLYHPDQKLTLIVLSNLETFNWNLMAEAVESAFIRHRI